MFVSARGLLLVVYCLLVPCASAQPLKASPVAAQVLGALPDSARVKMLAAIARGDIAGAISMWQLATGRDTVPPALAALQSAFNVANRVAGPCARVAGDIYEAFESLGGNPQLLRISSTEGEFLSWQGRRLMSDNNVHFVVMYEDRIYDAFTGPAGMLRAEYLKNVMMDGEPVVVQVTQEALKL